jgi:hypothetical protein
MSLLANKLMLAEQDAPLSLFAYNRVSSTGWYRFRICEFAGQTGR